MKKKANEFISYFNSNTYMNLTTQQESIIMALRNNNLAMLLDVGALDRIDLNFHIVADAKVHIYPLMIAVSKGRTELIEKILLNKTINVNATDPYSGVNAFWLSCLY